MLINALDLLINAEDLALIVDDLTINVNDLTFLHTLRLFATYQTTLCNVLLSFPQLVKLEAIMSANSTITACLCFIRQNYKKASEFGNNSCIFFVDLTINKYSLGKVLQETGNSMP